MDIKTALSIYNKHWLIEPQAAAQMLEYWEKVIQGNAAWNYRKAMSMEDDGDEEQGRPAFNIQKQLYAGQKVIISPDSRYDMYDFKGFDGAETVIIPISGPLMKADYCGSFGTASLMQMFQLADQTPSVRSIIMLIDSPGGMVDGTKSFADTIKASKKETTTIAEGTMCSAAEWIGSASKQVFASSETDIIGSIGTMCSLVDNSKAMEARGVVIREFYATASKDKNGAFTQAIQGDGKKLIAETLDPLNDVFIGAIKDNRAGKIDLKKEDVTTGKTYVGKAAQAAGLIDGIQSLNQVIASTKTKSKVYSMSTKNFVFQNVLKASGADAITPTEGGFLMTEEMLTAVDSQLTANATTIKTLSGQIANPVDPAAAAKTTQDLATANEKIKTLQGQLTAETTAKEAAEAKAVAAGKQPGGFFQQTITKQDPPPEGSHEDLMAKSNAKFAAAAAELL